MSWLKNRLGLSLATLAIVASGAFAYAQSTIDPTGRPENTHAGAAEHYAVWHDHDGWHIRTMTKEHEHHFKGKVECKGGEMEAVHGKGLEGKGAQADHWKVGPHLHELVFDFSTKGGEDGIDFKVDGKDATLSFDLEIGEKEPKAELDRIFIGKAGAHPTENPFTFPAHPAAGGKHNKK